MCREYVTFDGRTVIAVILKHDKTDKNTVIAEQ